MNTKKGRIERDTHTLKRQRERERKRERERERLKSQRGWRGR